MIRLFRWSVKLAALVVTVSVVYLAVTFGQVWTTARHDDRSMTGAIVVLGAAQYDGRPSPVLASRLDHAVALYEADLAPIVVVTGGRRPGDRFTEAGAAAKYLARHGVPEKAIRREVTGRNSWESLAAAARFLRDEGVDDVTLVSDPFHSARIGAIAGEVGLKPHLSPTRTSPIRGSAELRAMTHEAGEVAVGRFIGYRRLLRLNDVAQQLKSGLGDG